MTDPQRPRTGMEAALVCSVCGRRLYSSEWIKCPRCDAPFTDEPDSEASTLAAPAGLRARVEAFVAWWDHPPYMATDAEITEQVDALRAALEAAPRESYIGHFRRWADTQRNHPDLRSSEAAGFAAGWDARAALEAEAAPLAAPAGLREAAWELLAATLEKPAVVAASGQRIADAQADLRRILEAAPRSPEAVMVHADALRESSGKPNCVHGLAFEHCFVASPETPEAGPLHRLDLSDEQRQRAESDLRAKAEIMGSNPAGWSPETPEAVTHRYCIHGVSEYNECVDCGERGAKP